MLGSYVRVFAVASFQSGPINLMICALPSQFYKMEVHESQSEQNKKFLTMALHHTINSTETLPNLLGLSSICCLLMKNLVITMAIR